MPFSYSLEEQKEIACYYWSYPEISTRKMSGILGVDRKTLRAFAKKFQPEGRYMPFSYPLEKRKEMSDYYWSHPEMSIEKTAAIFGVGRETIRRSAIKYKNSDEQELYSDDEDSLTSKSAIINGIKHVSINEFCRRTRAGRMEITERFNYKITRIKGIGYIAESFVDRYPSFMRELKVELNKAKRPDSQ